MVWPMSTSAAQFAPPEPLEKRQAWWGVRYVATMCAQAGYLFVETPPEGDIHSLDGTVHFRPGLPVSVQVKCSHTPFRRSRSWTILQAWRRNWSSLYLPTYFVHVSVPADIDEWAEHGSDPWTTLLQCAAFWTRIDPLPPGQRSIQVVASRRLTVDTFSEWADDLSEVVQRLYTGGGGAP